MNRQAKRERLRRVRRASVDITIAMRDELAYATTLWIGKRICAQNRLRNAWRYGSALVPLRFWRNPKSTGLRVSFGPGVVRK